MPRLPQSRAVFRSGGPFERAAAALFGDLAERLRLFGDFGVAAVVPTLVLDDLDVAIDLLRPNLALYIGGWGARDENYHYEVFARMNGGRYEGICW